MDSPTGVRNYALATRELNIYRLIAGCKRFYESQSFLATTLSKRKVKLPCVFGTFNTVLPF